MADTRINAGSSPVPSPTLVQCDQETVVGDGSHERPLRAGPGFASVVVEDEGSRLGAFATLNFVGAGVEAVDDGDGVARVSVPGGVVLRDEGVMVDGGPHREVDFSGDGVRVVDLGGGSARVLVPGAPPSVSRSVLVWGLGLLTSRPAFVQPGGAHLSPDVSDRFGVPVPYSGVVRSMHVRHNVSGGDGRDAVYTLTKNGAATVLSVAIPTGDVGQMSNTTEAVPVDAGDVLSLRVDSASASGLDEFDAAISVEILGS